MVLKRGVFLKKLLFISVLAALLIMAVAPAYASDVYKSVAKDGYLELLYEETSGSVQVKDLRNGYIWKSVVDESMYDLEKLNRQWANYLRSPVVITYCNILIRDAPQNTLYSYAYANYTNPDTKEPQQTVFTTPITNGVSVEYKFPNVGLSVTVEYLLENGDFVVRVPADKIKEEPYTVILSTGKESIVQNAVVTVKTLPFFGAAGNDDMGYIFYPDGSGAITRFEMVEERPQEVRYVKWDVFSDTSGNVESIMYGGNTAYLPVYGIKNGDNAYLAAITKGYDKSTITVYPSGYVVNLNHADFGLDFRSSFQINMSDISTESGRASKMATRVDQNITMIDKEIRYFLLSGDNADYSGMAAAYREYLLGSGQLRKNITNNGTLPLYLNLFMGILEEGVLFDTFVPMTTFDQTIDILSDLQRRGVSGAEVNLRGWQSQGYSRYPIVWPVESKLGGEKGLEKLDKYLSSAGSGFNVYLENCFNIAYKGNSGFSTRTDVAINGVNLPLQVSWGDEYLLKPLYSKQRNEAFIKNINKYTNINVAYQNLGRILFSDYTKSAPLTREDTANIYAGMLGYSRENGKKTMLNGANVFLLANSDFLYDIPIGARNYFITDEEVPFIQMLVSGLIGYSTGTGNLSSDLQKTKLRWIESGCAPKFELTFNDSVNLQNTNYSSLFTSTYSKWADTVEEVYKELNQNLGDVYGRQMVKHERIAADVVKVVYDNGKTIILNYNETIVTVEGIVIQPVDYVIVNGGAAR